MKLKHWHLIALALSVTLLTETASAQEWARKMFDKTSHDFGKVARGADVSHRFKVTNLYKETVHISNVRTTCGCSIPKQPAVTTLKSLESTYVEVELNTRKFTHKKESNLVVTFDKPFFAEVKLPLQAYIRTDVVLTPGGANFGAVDLGAGATTTVDVAYAGRDDWILRDVKIANQDLDAKVTEVSRGNGQVKYQIEMHLKPSAPLGALREEVMLITNDAVPTVPMLVTARVEADITVATPDVSMGTLAPGANKTVNVVIRGKKPFMINKVECESDKEMFQVRLPNAPRTVHIIPLTITPPKDPGPFSEKFTVSIDGRDEPVSFTAHGTISPAF
ncbi:MAG: DUF1573 domain-containing protein [Planctomycetaceae bacterium]|nr:DUF1573 domain-containing protein [Planctomycetaceae bacterium]